MIREKTECYIIGGGNSVRKVDTSKLFAEDTIVVNKAVLYIVNPTYFVSMDYSFMNSIKLNGEEKEYFRKLNIPKYFIVNLGNERIVEKRGVFVDSRRNLKYDLKDYDIIIKSKIKNNISLDWQDFRSGNSSGYCALQLAVLMGYKEINMLGLDFNIPGDETHFHGGYGEGKEKFQESLNEHFKYFRTGIEELKLKDKSIKLYTNSKHSRLNELAEVKYKEII